MARGSKTRHDSEDTTDISSVSTLLSTPVPPSRPLVSLPSTSDFVPLFEFEDRRQFNPAGELRSSMSMRGSAAPIVGDGESLLQDTVSVQAAMDAPEAVSVQRSLHRPGFSAFGYLRPREALVCVRRQARREVIFARGYRRRGSGGKRRFNVNSKVKC